MISPTPPLTAPANPNDQLTNSYLCNYAPQTVWDGSYTGLAPRGTPAVNVNISGIPYASYKVYVYFDGAPGEARRLGIIPATPEETTTVA